MPFDTSTVLQAWDGQLFAAPAGTPLPADLAAPLDAAFIGVGWLTDDGLTFTPGVDAPDAIRGWPRGEVLLRPPPTLEPEFGFALAQHDADALTWITDVSAERALVLQYRATATSRLHRLVLPLTRLSDAGEMPLNTEDLAAVEITVGCRRDDTAGYTFAFLIPDGDTGTTIRSY
jgi:hypothetical protein